LLVALFPISSDAWAWGDEGHKVIREIALRLIQPGTRAMPPRRPSGWLLYCAFLHIPLARTASTLTPVWEVQGGPHMAGNISFNYAIFKRLQGA